MPQDIVSIDKKTRKKSAPKWTFLTPIFWPFHRCETGKRGYEVKIQVSQIKKWLAFLNRGSLSIVGGGFVKIPPQFYEKGSFYV